jgi:hypothetical protein
VFVEKLFSGNQIRRVLDQGDQDIKLKRFEFDYGIAVEKGVRADIEPVGTECKNSLF